MSQRNKKGRGTIAQPTTKQHRCWQVKTGEGNRERNVEGGGSADRRVDKRNGRKEYSRREMHKGEEKATETVQRRVRHRVNRRQTEHSACTS